MIMTDIEIETPKTEKIGNENKKLIYIWPDHMWYCPDDVEEDILEKDMGRDHMSIYLPETYTEEDVDKWIKIHQPQNSEKRKKELFPLDNYSISKCPDCGLTFIPEKLPKFVGVKCDSCGKFHKEDSQTYVAISGNITVGLDGGLVGNNFNTSEDLINVSILCRGNCFFNACKNAVKEEGE